jgi:uncharacterized protein YxeA
MAKKQNQEGNKIAHLDASSKVLLIILLVLIVISVALTYYRSVVVKDFEVFYDDYESVDEQGGQGEEK